MKLFKGFGYFEKKVPTEKVDNLTWFTNFSIFFLLFYGDDIINELWIV